jgi:hypothetical protein
MLRLRTQTLRRSSFGIALRGKGIAVLGTVTRFQERRGGVWVDVQRWIDVA